MTIDLHDVDAIGISVKEAEDGRAWARIPVQVIADRSQEATGGKVWIAFCLADTVSCGNAGRDWRRVTVIMRPGPLVLLLWKDFSSSERKVACSMFRSGKTSCLGG